MEHHASPRRAVRLAPLISALRRRFAKRTAWFEAVEGRPDRESYLIEAMGRGRFHILHIWRCQGPKKFSRSVPCHSGARYPAVPLNVVRTLLKSLPTNAASPKSATLGTNDASRSMFSGLISQSRRFRTTPVVSSTMLYGPKPGSIRLFLEMPCRIKPVTLFRPNLAPGRTTSVGWSKLCHNRTSDDGLATMARFPVFKRTALAVFVPVPVILAMLVDQIVDLVRFTTTRLPSVESSSCVWLMLGSVIGVSLLATHTVVKTGMLLNHMPRYQLGEVVVVLVDLLRLSGAVGWKKPSANLPFLETSLSRTAST
ncbi:hypothetical protein EJB05_57388 [Eragrostis curvula]|uniref:Uncharacterized protein n=1 Tax=Eragrostis curvula TaxID=38414 RepID=A0A5J9SE57_9POAL|nr:hypothetical protein EJB05_57388 [Eragrostis curvula]